MNDKYRIHREVIYHRTAFNADYLPHWSSATKKDVLVPLRYHSMKSVSRKDREEGLWKVERVKGEWRLYLTCVACGAINDATMNPIPCRFEGPVGSQTCVVCSGCQVHFFPEIEGYTERIRARVAWTRRRIELGIPISAFRTYKERAR